MNKTKFLETLSDIIPIVTRSTMYGIFIDGKFAAISESRVYLEPNRAKLQLSRWFGVTGTKSERKEKTKKIYKFIDELILEGRIVIKAL